MAINRSRTKPDSAGHFSVEGLDFDDYQSSRFLQQLDRRDLTARAQSAMCAGFNRLGRELDSVATAACKWENIMRIVKIRSFHVSSFMLFWDFKSSFPEHCRWRSR